MNRNSVGLALAIFVGASWPLGSWSLAATITQTQGFVGNPTLKKTVEFDRFNPNHGELLSAEWRLILDIEGGSHTVDNDGPLAKTVNVYLGARGSLQSNDVRLLNTSMAPILQAESALTTGTSSVLNLDIDNGDGTFFDPTGPDARTHYGGFASAQGGGFVHPTFLADYVGTEMFELRVEIDQVVDLSDTLGISDQVEPVTAWPNLILTYQYNPVPEPAGILYVALALLSGVSLLLGRRS